MNKQETLAAYIKKLLDVQDEQLTDQDLRELAYEMGLDKEAYEELQEVYEDHLVRGAAFLKQENWDEAIAEFGQAVAINPLKPEGLMAQSGAYERKWQDVGLKRYREEALYHARRALKFDPDHEEAIAAVGRLEKSSFSFNTYVKIIGALAVLGLVIILYISLQSVEPALGDPPPKEKLAEIEDRFLVFDDVEIPIRFDRQGTESFTFMLHAANLISKTDYYNYQLEGRVRVEQGELSKVIVKMSLILEDGQIFNIQERRLLNETSVAVRVGDVVPFGFSFPQKKSLPLNVKELLIELSEISMAKEPSYYPASKPIDLHWSIDQPANLAIDAKLRYYEVDKVSSFPHSVVAIEATNTGTVPIGIVEFEIEWLDADGNSLHRGNQFLHSTYDPPLMPGKTYVCSSTYGLRKFDYKKIESYRINVIRARPSNIITKLLK